jgi:hypothetical protein
MGFNHRQAWFTNLARLIGLPMLTLNLTLRLFRPTLDSSKAGRVLSSKLALAVLYVLAVPTFWSVRNVVMRLRRAREAKRLGGFAIPHVRGRLPGNIDILMR